jgi:hypothetical protein
VLGISLAGAVGLGGVLVFSSFPENYYHNTGEKVIDLDRAWVFDHNPFVLRGYKPTQVVNLWSEPWPHTSRSSSKEFFNRPVLGSVAERTASIFNHIAYLRHPRLYLYEDLPTLDNRIVIHTTGKTFAPSAGEDKEKVLSKKIIGFIRKRYKDHELIQVGSRGDMSANIIDCRGLKSIWETVKIIAQARMFIGVDSGPSWIAASYPRIFNKKILMQYSPEFLRTSFIPMHSLLPHQHWFDTSFMYFNRSENDAGITYSYLKI